MPELATPQRFACMTENSRDGDNDDSKDDHDIYGGGFDDYDDKNGQKTYKYYDLSAIK